MEEKLSSLYDYEDVKSFPKPIDMPPFWVSASGVSYCDADYHIYRKESKVCVCEYIIKGTGTVHIKGKTFYPKAGDIYILPEFENHEYYTDPKDPWIKIFFNIRGTGVSSMLNIFELKNKFIFSDCEDIYPLFEAMLLKVNEDIPIEQIMKECCKFFVEILFTLYNKAKATNHELLEAQNVKNFIESNVERELTLKEIADSIYRSQDYTNKLFKRYYNETAYAYYNNLRLEKAKALLLHTSLHVWEIAEKLGYKNGKSFSKFFYNKTGMSATRYRNVRHGTRKNKEEMS